MRSSRWIPLLVFGVLAFHGSHFGLTDDEAYYWVLAQRPAWGYAFHPPAIAWSLAIFQTVLSSIFSSGSSALVRLPSAFFTASIVGLGLRWMLDAGATETGLKRGGAALLAFAGMFAVGWMMVPDLPLFVGWMLAFNAVFRLTFREPKARDLVALSLGLCLAILSKYSGVLAAPSAAACLILWAPRRVRNRGLIAILMGVGLGVVPILLSAMHNGWGSLLYQLSERHGGAHLSGSRYARFWAIQLVLTGPLLFYAFRIGSRIRKGTEKIAAAYVAIWSAPAALIYFSQPLMSEFKPHWALIAWLPFALELGLEWSHAPRSLWGRAQAVYGFPLIILVFLACHVPIGSALMTRFGSGTFNPKLDVTNDLYGWHEFPEWIRSLEESGEISKGLPVLGSRYQTASQADFALGDPGRVTLIPRDAKQMAEWPSLAVAESQGPDWPKLTRSVLFVSDNRYDAGPAFKGARCFALKTFEKYRGQYLAREIHVWRCDP